MKKPQKWFREKLPRDVAELAIQNIQQGKEAFVYSTFERALSGSFVWRESPQGYSYWNKIHKKKLNE